MLEARGAADLLRHRDVVGLARALLADDTGVAIGELSASASREALKASIFSLAISSRAFSMRCFLSSAVMGTTPSAMGLSFRIDSGKGAVPEEVLA